MDQSKVKLMVYLYQTEKQTMREIAEQLNVSLCSVHTWLHKEGVKPRKMWEGENK